MAHYIFRLTLVAGVLVSGSLALAAEPFGGRWAIDLRSASERQRGAECGIAAFTLQQTGDSISGSRSMATVDCGRLNEEGPVVGTVVGSTAVLVVTSGRDGTIVMGKAKLANGKLQWQTLREVQVGADRTDSPLILEKGSLVRSNP
ncbi:MAG: hypothetical protein JSS14_26555 [Proteobacteria bacterium]|nr:hypothetical protein [Pseudomonadota bacterium]